jgi:hypothetical protein
MDTFTTKNSMHVHLAEHTLLIDAPTIISGPTRRPTYVIIWSTTNRNFSFSNTAGKLLFEGHAAWVATDVERQLKIIDSNIFSLNTTHPFAKKNRFGADSRSFSIPTQQHGAAIQICTEQPISLGLFMYKSLNNYFFN